MNHPVIATKADLAKFKTDLMLGIFLIEVAVNALYTGLLLWAVRGMLDDKVQLLIQTLQKK
jgi:hypothetical protein